MLTRTFTFPGINPEPWAIGPVGWTTRGGKRIPTIGPMPQVKTYQKAIGDELKKYILPAPLTCKVRFEFYFWRRLDKHTTTKGREVQAKVSDATNMQKSTEDALQKILIVNDNQVKDIRSVVVEEGEFVTPGVIIKLIIPEGNPIMNVDIHVLEAFLAAKEGVFDPNDLDGLLKME